MWSSCLINNNWEGNEWGFFWLQVPVSAAVTITFWGVMFFTVSFCLPTTHCWQGPWVTDSFFLEGDSPAKRLNLTLQTEEGGSAVCKIFSEHRQGSLSLFLIHSFVRAAQPSEFNSTSFHDYYNVMAESLLDVICSPNFLTLLWPLRLALRIAQGNMKEKAWFTCSTT